MRMNMKIDLQQPLEDLMSDHYEIVDSLEDLEKEELYRAAVDLEPLEAYLIHLNVIWNWALPQSPLKASMAA